MADDLKSQIVISSSLAVRRIEQAILVVCNLKCQFGISSSWGGRRHAPYVFTEQGVAMLSSVLHSRRAVLVGIGT